MAKYQTTLLPDEAVERLIHKCQAEVGDSLRSITFFTHTDFDQLYLREDLERAADLASFIGVEWRESGITQDVYRASELGEHTYTIRAFRNGYLLRVTTDHDGIFITTDDMTINRAEDISTAISELLTTWAGA